MRIVIFNCSNRGEHDLMAQHTEIGVLLVSCKICMGGGHLGASLSGRAMK